MTTATATLPTLRARVFVSAWSNYRGRVSAVGADLTDDCEIVDDARPADNNGRYETRDLVPPDSLATLWAKGACLAAYGSGEIWVEIEGRKQRRDPDRHGPTTWTEAERLYLEAYAMHRGLAGGIA